MCEDGGGDDGYGLNYLKQKRADSPVWTPSSSVNAGLDLMNLFCNESKKIKGFRLE